MSGDVLFCPFCNRTESVDDRHEGDGSIECLRCGCRAPAKLWRAAVRDISFHRRHVQALRNGAARLLEALGDDGCGDDDAEGAADKAVERLAELERERVEAVAALDENWMTHQRVAAVRKLAAAVRADLEDAKRNRCFPTITSKTCKALEEAEAAFDEALPAQPWAAFARAQDPAWPVADLLRILANAGEHLLHVHDCDAHGYETTSIAAKKAKAILTLCGLPVEAAESETPGCRPGAGEPEPRGASRCAACRGTGWAVPCSFEGCEEPAMFEAWVRNRDGFGFPTGLMRRMPVCLDHAEQVKAEREREAKEPARREPDPATCKRPSGDCPLCPHFLKDCCPRSLAEHGASILPLPERSSGEEPPEEV